MSGLRYIDLHSHQKRASEQVLSVLDIPLSRWSQMKDEANHSPFSISLHPSTQKMEQLDQLKAWVDRHRDHPQWIALGEVGFDPTSPLSIEHRLQHFRTVVTLAEEEQKILIVHCVKEFALLRKIYDEILPSQTWVLHGFRKKRELMHQWLLPHIGFGIGIHQPEQLIEELPLDRVFLETDDQSTQPIEEIYRRFAQSRGLTVEQLQQQIENNYSRITHKIINDEFC